VAIDIDDYYRRYGPMVLRRCRRLLGDEEQAVDALQDTFVQLLRHQDRITDDGPSSLLYRMATNVCLNRIRSRRRRPEHPGEELLQRIAGSAGPERRVLARLGLGRLFARELESTQTIAVMHLLDGMTLEEVAGEVGLSVSGVRKRLRQLRAHLVELEGV
jgi:RNA polymerase sigma-70 factor (ECF subfamily)